MNSVPLTPDPSPTQAERGEKKPTRKHVPGALWRLIGLVLPFWRGMALAALIGALTIASSVGLMMTSAWLITKAALMPSIADLGVAIVAVRFFGIARGVFRYLERLTAHETTFRLLAHLRVRFYQAIEPLAPARLAAFRSGDLLSRVVDDIESLQNVYLRAIAPPLVALMIAAGLTLVLAAFDPLVALVALSWIGLAAGLPLLAWRIGQGAGRAQVQTHAALNATLIDGIQGIGETLVYGRAAAQLAELEALNRRLGGEEMRLAWLDGAQTAGMIALANGAALAVLIVAIPRVDPIWLATLALGTTAAFEALMPLTQAATQLGANGSAAERLFEVVDSPPAVRDPPEPIQLNALTSAEIRFEQVSFRYEADAPLVLEDVTLTIPAGAKIAVVGASGSGKSTLVNMIVRFWDADSGQITLGGRDVRAYRQKDVRQMIGVMEQRTHLFNTTIRENIWIGRREASEDEVIAAARAANLHEFVMSLPEGYSTLVGEGGLSGGERQRVALARVLLKNAPILVLDEPTANLDALNERTILETILARKVEQGKTLLLLTHRLALLDRMDAIVVMRQGRIVEQGTHADLMAKDGAYRRMHKD